ncbi:hypothetical protein [Actinomyces timonensis]|uniref:hypothetical protein n=1 Tax=Actinomyces timonensis TaxID=1288391 RepID=UPI00030D319B|nr:hypothetical protein [Actinomyces timonensis]
MSGDELQLISDGSGLAVIGDAGAVDRFLTEKGLAGRPMDLSRIAPALGKLGLAAQAGGVIAQSSGRWVKLSAESAKALTNKDYKLVTSRQNGLAMGVLRGEGGRFAKNLQFESDSLTRLSPAAVAGLGAVMTQMAIQKILEDIQEFLKVIDEKVDDLIQMQKDAALAGLIGVGKTIRDALMAREEVGKVAAVTWSKIDDAPQTIATGEAFALRRLAVLTEKVEKKGKVAEVAKIAADVEKEACEWLVVLARCAALQDACDVLEIDRVLGAHPEDVEEHRRALALARDTRRKEVREAAEGLLSRLNAVASLSDRSVVAHPKAAQRVIDMRNRVADVFEAALRSMDIDADYALMEPRTWRQAVRGMRQEAVQAAAELKNVAVESGRRAVDSGLDATAGVLTAAAFRAEQARPSYREGLESARDADDSPQIEP